jgi:hypothetical protein
MKKLLLASVLAIASFPGYAHAAQGYEEGAPCHDFTGKEYERCAARVGYCERDCNAPTKKDLTVPPTKELAACVTTCLNAAYAADDKEPKPPARVTVTPPYQGPPPIGWVYGPYTQCADPPHCSTGVVNVPADGLNVRVVPNGPPVMSLVNGTPLIPLGREGDWLLVAAGCDLTPTFAWSWTAGVPLNRCWVYF